MGIERIIPGTIEWDAFYANHIFRYEFALQQLKKNGTKKLLDAACGVGYGSNYLAKNGIQQVVAIDRSPEALSIANKEFAAPSITFLQDDCYTLAAAEKLGPYEAIVSCETLEHLAEPDRFLDSCYKVLQPGGILFITTPNFDFSPNRTEVWEFHEKEYTAAEFETILQKHGFKNIMLYGQSYSEIGILRQEVRAQLNRVNSNPFIRAGRLLQTMLRRRKFSATLPEKINDFIITERGEFTSNPPFVLFAVAFKG